MKIIKINLLNISRSLKMGSLAEFKSLKEFRKSRETPKFKFNSEKGEDILNPKSKWYKDPNVQEEMDKHQATWRFNMKPLRHPHSVRHI